jgi:hypothetical protein
MRLSASRIRSINRAIARVQKFAWSSPDKCHRRSISHLTPAVPATAAKFVKVVAVSRSATS